MDPILLIHGYSAEGKDNTVGAIYGNLPKDLRQEFGNNVVKEIDLSRWISLNDGIALDDVSFAMERALREQFPDLLSSGFHVIIHSTGALVVRNWIRLFSAKPSPIKNLIYLAGANFGSGLAHIGQGQLARWGRLIFSGTGRGTRVLRELEFGSWKTIDLHRSFLEKEKDMYKDYQVQEFCMNGSQTLPGFELIPIRYIKEDSSDSTVRTSACNLNFNYIPVKAKETGKEISKEVIRDFMEKRLCNERVTEDLYEPTLSYLCKNREPVPFAVLFETAHFGEKIGIVNGTENRTQILPLIKQALQTPYNLNAYRETARVFDKATSDTFSEAAKLKEGIFEGILGWNKQEQYEGHAQLIFRLRDQFGNPVENFDITIKSKESPKKGYLEKLIEDKHNNDLDKGAITFYLRTQKFKDPQWEEQLKDVKPIDVEITGHEALSEEINYLPLTITLNSEQIQEIVQSFRTTIFDIELLRMPSEKVFAITKTQ